MPEVLGGLGVSPGPAAGPAVLMAPPPRLPPPRPVTDADAENALAERALLAVRADLEARAAAATTAAARDILGAQAAMAADPTLSAAVRDQIAAGSDAAHALHEAFAAHRRILAGLGGYLAERAADLDDLGSRALAAALNLPMPGVPAPGFPFVLLAEDLAPADTAALDPADVLALVTEKGGPTSHTAILARALGIPAVVGCRDLLAVAERHRRAMGGRRDAAGIVTLVTVDGATGKVELGVDQDTMAAVRARAAAERTPVVEAGGPAVTRDGHAVEVMVNIGSAADLTGVDVAGVAGVGLFRTEFLFLDRTAEPSLEEQVRAYRQVFDAFDHGTIIVRTLDAGADKPLPFLALPAEPNPALGLRGFRTARHHPEVLARQLRAIAMAADGAAATIAVMAPMISTVDEADAFVRLARDHGLTTAGVMIEVPAAALQAAWLAQVTDFLSIGTNDLGQYTMAIDRQSGHHPELLDFWQPALLRLIADCAAAGRAAGKSVGVCGEAAADPLLAPVLVGMGITRLSMAPRSIPAVRAGIARHDLATCRRLAQRVPAAKDATEARAAAQAG